MTPIYEHDCHHCHYLGSLDGMDMWICEAVGIGSTYIVRHSGEPSGYWSGCDYDKKLENEVRRIGGIKRDDDYKRVVCIRLYSLCLACEIGRKIAMSDNPNSSILPGMQ